jgi:DNA-binding GntR family transcriptional regulator
MPETTSRKDAMVAQESDKLWTQISPDSFIRTRRSPVRINSKSLRQQVYEFLREELHTGRLAPGSAINLTAISEQLGISKTPLRDALLQLDAEGFVSISPRRGVYVSRLTLEEIRHGYEIVGALETAALISVFDRIEPYHLTKMRWINSSLITALEREDFAGYYSSNIDFHHVFLDLSDNETLRRIILPIKQRLYDFPRRGYLKEWEMSNCQDHEQLIEAIEKGDRSAARHVWREVHWAFAVQEQYIRHFYFAEETLKTTPPDTAESETDPGMTSL